MSGESTEQPPSLAKRVRDWAPWEIIIPLSPAIGYGLAYLHEFGFVSVFGIPSDLIRIELISVLRASSIVFLFLVLLFSVLVIAYGFSWARDKKGRWVGDSLPWLVSLALFLWLVSNHPSVYVAWVPPLAVFLLWLVCRFILKPLMSLLKSLVKWLMSPVASLLTSQARVHSLIDKLRAMYQIMRAQLSKSDEAIIPYLQERKQLVIVVGGLLILLMLASLASYYDGVASAMDQQYFWVSDNQQAVVLRFYGDELVCAPSDNTAEDGFQRRFFVMKMDDEPRPVLILKRIRD